MRGEILSAVREEYGPLTMDAGRVLQDLFAEELKKARDEAIGRLKMKSQNEYNNELLKGHMDKDKRGVEYWIMKAIGRLKMKNQNERPSASLVDMARALEEKHARAMELLGEMVTTFSLEQNRETILKGIGGKALLDLADRWKQKFDALEEPEDEPGDQIEGGEG